MTVAEVVGLVLAAALAGAGLALAVTSLRGVDARDRPSRPDRRALLLDWLCAWKRLSRAYLAFVAAQRALSSEPDDSRRFSYRCKEVLRARSELCRAQRSFDRAAARLSVYSGRTGLDARFCELPAPRGDELRWAVNGDRYELERLARSVHESARAAETIVRDELDRLRNPVAWVWLRTGAARLREITDRWAAPPPLLSEEEGLEGDHM